MGEGSEKEESKEEGEVMDTPERSRNNQIAASVSKFEDSPVFTFLNSLSPIKPVKSMPITQTINSLSFASIPSVFTSPHVSSLKGSRFLRRHQLSDPSKPEFSSDDANAVNTSNVNTDVSKQLDGQLENVDRRASDDEEGGEQSFDCSKYVVEFAEGLSYDCNSPNSGLKTKCIVPLTQDASRRGLYISEVNMEEGVSQIDHTKEGTSCEWENLVTDDASDLLIFESPNDKSIEHGDGFYNDMQNMHAFCGVGEESEQEHLSTQPGEGIEMIGNGETGDTVAGPSVNDSDEKIDYENLSGLYRGMRRRCLVFEMGGARRKYLEENSGSDSSALLQSDGITSSNDQRLVAIKIGNESSRRLLPGIGLHLNALATTPKDYKIVSHDSSASGRLLIGPSSSLNYHAPSNSQDLLNNILPDREVDSVENAVLPVEDASLEEINPSSPKKKRRRVEQGGEGESCKRCNCKKSKCLKLYCECFAAGVYCVEPCACIDCFNKPIHEDTVLATRKQIESRNPLAFAPKVIRGAESVSETRDDSSKTPASARHKRGCNCKKSGCLKKYCECYQGGVGCSINCRCEGCKNAFGRKDGTEVEVDEDETDMTEKTVLDRSFQKAAVEVDPEQNLDSVPPATPLRGGRQSVHLPFSSKKKPPRSSFPSIGSSSGFYCNQGFGKPSFVQPAAAKLDKHFETVDEDEMPEFLQEGSPGGGVKLSSPNGKRVSPPHGIGTSSSLRSSRKLILQSIPSFPSLTHNQ